MEVNFLTKSKIQPNSPLLCYSEQNGYRETSVKNLKYNGRPTKDVSFRGSTFLKAPKALANIASDAVRLSSKADTSQVKIPKYAKKLVNSNGFGKIIEKVLSSEAVVEAAIVLGLTTTLKPLCTLIMPGASKDDKEVLATKHALSGLVGYGFSKILYSPLAKAANKVSRDPETYLKGDTEYIKKITKGGKLHECFDVFWKKGPDVVASIPKSMLTVALITPTLAFLFPNHKKSQKGKPNKKQQQLNNLINQKISNDNLLTFKGKQDNNVSFTGLKVNDAAQAIGKTSIVKQADEQLTEVIAKGIGKVSMLKPVKKITEGLTKFKKPAPLLSNLSSIVLTLSLLNNTAKSKTIEKERKPYLLLNTALVTIISSIASTIIDFCSDGFLESMKKAYMSEKLGFNDKQIKKGLQQLSEIKEFGQVKDAACEILTSDNVKQLNRYMLGVNKLKSHTIFSFVVRFASPLLVVPLTTKVLDIFEKINKKKNKDQTAQETP